MQSRSDLFRVETGSDMSLAENKYRVQIYADGVIAWMPGFKFRTTCLVYLTKFPFDRQTCFINLTSWMYPIQYVELNVRSEKVIVGQMQANGEWDLVKASADRFLVNNRFGIMSIIYFTIELKRKSRFYVMHLVLPAVTMSIMSVFVFILPVESGEKISLGISLFIAYSVLILLVADNMPTNANAMPVLCTYPASHYCLQLY